MKTRTARLFLALGLLAVIWPAFAALAGTAVLAAVGLAAAHPAVLVALAAAVLLLGTVPGPVDRALTHLSRTTSERTPR
jgi:hypothetical protein